MKPTEDRMPMIRVSKTAAALAKRIVVMLGADARPVKWFRALAATDAVFEQAIGRLFLKNRVRFIGSGRGRWLARSE